jgi:phage/plasmid-associated DNA primase
MHKRIILWAAVRLFIAGETREGKAPTVAGNGGNGKSALAIRRGSVMRFR